MEAMEASFSAFHQKLRRCFSDFEALLVAHINTTSSSPNQSPLSLIESSSISLPLSSLNLHSPAVQFVARSLTVPTHICVYSNSPQTPPPSTSRPAVRTAAAFNFTLHPHTPTVNPLFPPHPQTTHIPRALASKIPQIQEIIFDLDSLGVDFFCNHAHPPLISTPVSQTISTDYFFFYLGVIVLDIHRFPPRSFAPAPSLYLKISNAKPILFGPAITSWNEEPPGSLCLELNPPLKSLLVGFIKSDMEMIPWVEEPPGSWFRFMLLYQDEESGEPESAAVNLFLEQLWSYTCCSKGPYYFGFKADKFFIHDIVDALYKASLYARVNGEVMPDQLESQVEPAIDISVGDELWTAPIISVSITEIAGVVVSFDSKLIEVDWITHPVQEIRSNHHLEDKVVLKALGMIHPSVGPQSTPSMEP